MDTKNSPTIIDEETGKVENITYVSSINSSDNHLKQHTFDNVNIPFKQRWNLFWSFKKPNHSLEPKSLTFWYPSDSTAYEKKLYFKLDCFLLTFVSLTFFIKYLEYSSMQYAYTAGLKEAFNLSGTDYNWIDNGYYICYAVGGLFGVLLTAYFPPRIVFPCFELSWVVFTILNCAAHDFTSQLVLRCFQGGLAGMAFPSISYILGTFYPPELLSSRTCIFIFAGCVGPIIGGVIQSGLYGALEGKNIGIPAFKMAQVVDGLIGLPVAISGFFAIPPVTGDKGNLYLSREDIQHLFKRTEQSSEQTHNKFNVKFIWSVLTSWQLWLFCLLFSAEQIAGYAASFQSIVLKSQGYSVYDCNNLPTIQSGVKAVASLLAGVLIELKGKRFEVYLLICAIWMTGLAILVKYDVARIAQFIGYALTGVSSPVSAILLSWANTASRNRGAGFRAFVLGSLNIAAQICLTPIGVLIFDTSLAPRFTTGMRLGLAMVVLQVFGACALLWCDRYERRLADFIDEQSTESDEKI